MKKMDPVSAIGASGVMDLQKLAEWFANSRLDPNDPSNADIVYMLRVINLVCPFTKKSQALMTLEKKLIKILWEEERLVPRIFFFFENAI